MSATLSSNRRIFDSVFPYAQVKGLAPTPVVTPKIGLTAAGQSFGGFQTPTTPISEAEDFSSEPYPEQVIWDRSWHVATSLLVLPEQPIGVEEVDWAVGVLEKKFAKLGQEAIGAIRYVTSSSSSRKGNRSGKSQYDLQEWYTNQLRRHFLTYTRPKVLDVSYHS